MGLPNKEKVIDFDYVTKLGEKYTGQFTILCSLDVGKTRILEIEKSKLLADLNMPTNDLYSICTILAELRVRIIDGPQWWLKSNGGLSIEEEEVIAVLYNKIVECKNLWIKEIMDKAQNPNP